MLNEFYEKIKDDLGKLAKTELEKLVATGATERHDFVRGNYHGIAKAITTIDEAFSSFNEKEEPVKLSDVRDAATGRTPARGGRYSRGG